MELKERRLDYLDGLRGIAALSVVVFHYTMIYGLLAPISDCCIRTPISLLWDGSAAVSVFFILSGFALSYGHLLPGSNKKIQLWRFYLARICRLMIPYWVIVIITFGCVEFLFQYADTDPKLLSKSFLNEWVNLPSQNYGEFIRQAFLVEPSISYGWVPQAWTLSAEVYLSMLLPFLILLIKRSVLLFLCLLILVPVPTYVFHSPFYPLLLMAIFHFMLGVLLARYFHRFNNITVLDNRYVSFLMICAAFLALNVRYVINHNFQLFHPYSMTVWYISGLGAVTLIFFLMRSQKAKRVFSSPPLLKLGKVSYSLYLIHMVVLYLLVPWALSILNGLGIVGDAAWLIGMIFSILSSLFFAHWLTVWVDETAINLSRRVLRGSPSPRN